MRQEHYIHEKTQRAVTAVMKRLGRDRFHRDDIFINHLNFAVPDLDPAFDGFKIVHFTDIHFGHWVSPQRLEGIVAMINEQDADIVVNTGDFVSYIIDELADDMIQSFRNIKTKEGSFAVLGNHDHGLDLAKIRSILKAGNIIELANDVHTFIRHDAQLHVSGVDDISVGADRLDQVMAKIPPKGPAFMLAHEPDFADQTAATGRFFLQLSGHSHGTQIVLPYFGSFLRGNLFRKYPYGMYQVGDMVQVTSNGVGTHAMRLRINCPPELVVITLNSP